jgi:ABC-type amino acid transport substrate-binding protein
MRGDGMFEPLFKLLKEIFSLGTYREPFVALCLDHPVWATLLVAILLGLSFYLIITTIPDVFSKLRPLIGDSGIVMGAALVCALAIVVVFIVNKAMERVPTWTNARDVYVGDAIMLTWTFDGGADLAFEVEHARDEQFGTDPKSFVAEVYQKAGSQSYSRRIEDIRNDTRFFRIRAVDPHDHQHRLSAWSDTQRIVQYDSSYRRIAATGAVIIGISKIDHDDLFKWASGQPDGIDIRLVKAIVAELPARMGEKRTLEAKFDPMGWTELLDAPSRGRVDMIVAGISRGAAREQRYGISFSEPYFCTTQALIYRTGESVGSIRKMIVGKRAGFEKPSTSENLVAALVADAKMRGENPPEPHAYDRPEDVTYAIAHRSVDLGVTDMPFAVEAVLTARALGNSSLNYRPFAKSDLPASLPRENRVDEYAIGMRRGDALVPVVNDILKQLKSTGALTEMLQTTTRDYERIKGFPQGALADTILQPRPFECLMN